MKQPHTYCRRILLVVIGMTPQIVTETLYKLAVESDPPFIPTELHLVTTREGADSARHALLGVGEGQGWFHRLVEDYSLDGIEFHDRNIHIIADTEGQFIDDNQSSEHNRIASDFITEKIKEFTADDDCALHVSLAGGRKTMSFYAGYALSLYGRMQDRLSHILVDQVFQNHKDFFYPTPVPQMIEIGNRYFSSADARIILSDIPYVRMREYFPRALLGGEEGFQDTVEKIERFNGPSWIRLDQARRIVELNSIAVRLTDFEFAYYMWFCLRAKKEMDPVVFDTCNYMPEFLEVFGKLAGIHSEKYIKAEQQAEYIARKDEGGTDRFSEQKSYFAPHRSRLEGKIKKVLGERFAQPFLIHTGDISGRVSYALRLSPEAIELIE